MKWNKNVTVKERAMNAPGPASIARFCRNFFVFQHTSVSFAYFVLILFPRGFLIIMRQITPSFHFIKELYRTSPDAAAQITGNTDYPSLVGTVSFYQSPYAGLLIQAEIQGLPIAGSRSGSGGSEASSDDSGSFFFAMHIHEYGNCMPPFDKTGMHYNPGNALHPQHAGDLLPLLGNHGYAWCTFYDERFTLAEIIGKSVIIHRNPDDFHTQPSGNSGDKIGCGTIQWMD